MKNCSLLIFLGSMFLCFYACENSTQNIQLGVSPNSEVIKAMTLDEKAQLLVGDDRGFPRGYPPEFGGEDSLFGKIEVNVGQTKKLVPGAAGSSFAIPRLGIPSIVLADGPAGVRIDPTRPDTTKTFYATAFPIETLLASTWDTDLIKNVGECVGNEALEYGVDIMLAPALNIHRNPLGGRNFEYYSEDPILSGEMAAAMVNGVQSKGVGTSIKHFAANNNETNRMNINAVIDKKTLNEIYLKGFGIAVKKSHPWTIMSAYNKINGTYCPENAYLLDTILRQSWNFDGLIMTDWFGGRDRIKQVEVGNDLQMPGSKKIAERIVEAVKNGQLDESFVDKNVDRILNVIKKTPRFKKYKYSNNPDLKEHAKIAKQAAGDGMILLKNNNTLPLSQNIKTIAGFGLGFYNTIAVGTGSGNVNMAYTVSIEKGLENEGFTIPEEMKTAYLEHLKKENERVGKKSSYFYPDLKLNEKEWSVDELKKIAKTTDIAIYTILRTSGEFFDRSIENDFELTSIEKNQIEKIAKIFNSEGKKLIVLLNIGGVIETDSWKNSCDAILLTWQPGQEGGNAIAEILTGKINPSGKLPMTFPKTYSDVPSAKYFPNPELNPTEVVYQEKGLVGYRYYQHENVESSFEFGFGLSYTSFEYEDIKTLKENNEYIVKFSITNTGSIPGKEIAQLYLANKESLSDIELKSFIKTKLLKPGEKTDVIMKLTKDDFMKFNTSTNSWVKHAGNYHVMIGSSSHNIKLIDNILY